MLEGFQNYTYLTSSKASVNVFWITRQAKPAFSAKSYLINLLRRNDLPQTFNFAKKGFSLARKYQQNQKYYLRTLYSGMSYNYQVMDEKGSHFCRWTNFDTLTLQVKCFELYGCKISTNEPFFCQTKWVPEGNSIQRATHPSPS